MSQDKVDNTPLALLDQVVRSLDAVISDRRVPGEPPEPLAGHKGFTELRGKLLEIREITLAFANGQLSQIITTKGYVSGALKMLQAHLNHLTWQTQMISSGDYTQRVDFMGEFSEAFNSMVVQLETTVRALNESKERYWQMAITDTLTGLFNRRHFYSLAENEINRSCRHKHNLSLIMLDIDHFKRVNDTYGHDCGDNVLQMVAEVLRQSIRSTDVTARFGGEEFIVLLPETDLDGALAMAWRLRDTLARQKVETGSKSISITASLGVNQLRIEGNGDRNVRKELDELIKGADLALYTAKNAGRNQVKSASEAQTAAS